MGLEASHHHLVAHHLVAHYLEDHYLEVHPLEEEEVEHMLVQLTELSAVVSPVFN